MNHGQDSLHLITHREIFKTKNRTHGNPWLNELMPANFILINSIDAVRLGFRDNESVRMVSDSNPDGAWVLPNFGKKHLVAKLKVIEGIRPGVITFRLGYGTWANGSADYIIDGNTIKGNSANGTGIMANSAMMIDPHLKNVSLQDLVGGSVVFYDSPVRLVKESKFVKETLEMA